MLEEVSPPAREQPKISEPPQKVVPVKNPPAIGKLNLGALPKKDQDEEMKQEPTV